MSPATADPARNLKNAMVKENKLKDWLKSPFLLGGSSLLLMGLMPMEQPRRIDSPNLPLIKCTADLSRFEQKIVAFKSISSRFNWSYPLQGVHCLFGIVMDAYLCGAKMYYIHQALPKEAPHQDVYYLTDESLKEAKLHMRLATLEEMIMLHQSIYYNHNQLNGNLGFIILSEQCGMEPGKKKIA